MARRPNIRCRRNNENSQDDRCCPWLEVSKDSKMVMIELDMDQRLKNFSFIDYNLCDRYLTISIIRCPQIAHFSDVCWKPEY